MTLFGNLPLLLYPVLAAIFSNVIKNIAAKTGY
jgi:hypothetical protein